MKINKQIKIKKERIKTASWKTMGTKEYIHGPSPTESMLLAYPEKKNY